MLSADTRLIEHQSRRHGFFFFFFLCRCCYSVYKSLLTSIRSEVSIFKARANPCRLMTLHMELLRNAVSVDVARLDWPDTLPKTDMPASSSTEVPRGSGGPVR